MIKITVSGIRGMDNFVIEVEEVTAVRALEAMNEALKSMETYPDTRKASS